MGGDRIAFDISSRLLAPDLLQRSSKDQEALTSAVGATISFSGAYPGWESATDAPLVQLWQQAYRSTCGQETVPTLIHAGLETGLITDAVKGLEAISVGCDIHDLHTPAETMNLNSFARIYQTVVEFLRVIS